MRSILIVTLLLAAVACSSGQSAAPPAPVTTYGPASQSAARPPAPPAYAAAPASPYASSPYASSSRAAAPAPAAPAYAGAFRWHTRIADAQAQARAENKLILVGSTKPGCSLCEKFKTQIVPQAGTRASSVAVGYMVQALTPEAPQIWNQLKANLPRAGLMPLVGLFTPDLRYLTGFGGPADMNQLMNALATARRLYPVGIQAPQQPLHEERRTAQLNEYGEYEWTPLEELYPPPEDALVADVTEPEAPVLPPAPAWEAAPARVAVVEDTRLVAAPVAAPVVAAVPPPPPAPAWIPAPVARPAPPAAPPYVADRPVVAATPKPAARPNPPFYRDPEPALESWGEAALRQALEQIQRGELDRAKSTLAEVNARLPGSTLAREAAKGSVAIYNARRIQDADDVQREQLREAAERNLSSSMWAVLFRG